MATVNTRFTISRNKREGAYWGFICGRHQRDHFTAPANSNRWFYGSPIRTPKMRKLLNLESRNTVVLDDCPF